MGTFFVGVNGGIELINFGGIVLTTFPSCHFVVTSCLVGLMPTSALGNRPDFFFSRSR